MKNDVRRLILYYVLAFVPPAVVSGVLMHFYGSAYWVDENTPGHILSLAGLCMMVPAAAHILTRLITREGFSQKDMLLTMKLSGSKRYYAAALLIPPLYCAVSVILGVMYKDGAAGFDINGDTVFESTMLLLNGLALSVLFFMPAFGEEFGWRAYMMPKLEKLMPEPAALIVGGVLWGLWHAPLTIAGHNFGIGYAGYPVTGILRMCLMCTVIGIFLTYLTKKTGSVMPAAFAHMANNNCSGWLLPIVGEGSDLTNITFFSFHIALTAAVALVCILLHRRDRRAEATA